MGKRTQRKSPSRDNGNGEPVGLDAALTGFLEQGAAEWAPLDHSKLTTAEERAVFLLTGAGMIERRVAFRLRMAGTNESIEAVITATGEYGGVEAMEAVADLSEMEWSLLLAAHLGGCPPQEVTFCIALTDNDSRTN